MEQIVEFFLSVNKIGLIAFIGVFSFLVYEISLLRKERLKKQAPNIPHFNPQATISTETIRKQAVAAAPVVKPQIKQKMKTPVSLIVILVVMTVFFLGFSAYSVITSRQGNAGTSQTQNTVVTEIASPGLKIFSTSWIEIKDADMLNIKPGTKVIIGLETIDATDIDRARIKVNSKNWNISDITTQFNKEKKMYYKEYIIATGESKLKIDAQLHSSVDGWLGD